MRFRRGYTTRDFAKARYIFVTANRFLAAASRRFLVSEKSIAWQDCPPVLEVGQIATIAWLLKDRHLEDHKVSRELLGNCYAAVRPDNEWLGRFISEVRQAAKQSGLDPDKIMQDGMILQATRRIAQDMSFGRTVVLEKLNVVEILAKAKEETDSIRADHATAVEQVREEGRAAGFRLGQEAERHTQDAKDRAVANKIAKYVVGTVQAAVFLVLLLLVIVSLFSLSDWPPLIAWPLRILLVLAGGLGALDLIGRNPVSRFLDGLRRKVSDAALTRLRAE
jgi:hypothetical protein